MPTVGPALEPGQFTEGGARGSMGIQPGTHKAGDYSETWLSRKLAPQVFGDPGLNLRTNIDPVSSAKLGQPRLSHTEGEGQNFQDN